MRKHNFIYLFFFVVIISQSVCLNVLLPWPVGLLGLSLDLFRTIYILGRELYKVDFI